MYIDDIKSLVRPVSRNPTSTRLQPPRSNSLKKQKYASIFGENLTGFARRQQRRSALGFVYPMKSLQIFCFILSVFALAPRVLAEGLNAEAQAKVDVIKREIAGLAATPVVVDAVRTQNQNFPAEFAAMTQEKWELLPDLDPFVRGFTTNPTAKFLKEKKPASVSELFVSDANGCKVAFLAKTTWWSHKGKPKHDVPMTGQSWQGKIEVDKSTGRQQLQIAVPVLDAEKPIGSIVVGIPISALTAN